MRRQQVPWTQRVGLQSSRGSGIEREGTGECSSRPAAPRIRGDAVFGRKESVGGGDANGPHGGQAVSFANLGSDEGEVFKTLSGSQRVARFRGSSSRAFSRASSWRRTP
jgi:hypothetical protein